MCQVSVTIFELTSLISMHKASHPCAKHQPPCLRRLRCCSNTMPHPSSILAQQQVMTLHPWLVKRSHYTRHCTLVPLSRGEDCIVHCVDHGLNTTTCCGAHVRVLSRFTHVPCSCLRPSIDAPRCGHAQATLSLLSHSPPTLKSILNHFGSA